jgi:hypothetical protein
MLSNNFLCFSLMSHELIAIEVVQSSLILIYDMKCDKNLGKNVKMHCWEKISKSFFSLLICNKVITD